MRYNAVAKEGSNFGTAVAEVSGCGVTIVAQLSVIRVITFDGTEVVKEAVEKLDCIKNVEPERIVKV